MAAYDLGYADERFESVVSIKFRCTICLNVFKNPVQCRQNQHLFCRGCITKSLATLQKCPVCMEDLSIETLKDAPRVLTDYLSELRIRCDFFDRGCRQYIKLNELKRHVDDCGFAPATCSNEGCQAEVNKYELLHHESAVCEQRRVKCHNCERLSREVCELKANLAAVNSKLDEVETTVTSSIISLENDQRNGFGMVNEFNAKLDRLEAVECRLLENNQEIKSRLTAMSGQLAKLSNVETDYDSKVEPNQSGRPDHINETMNVVIAGGFNNGKKLNSVEKFNLSTGTWTEEEAMETSVYQASSVHFFDQMVISGGQTDFGVSYEMIRRNIGIKSGKWSRLAVQLPTNLRGHCTVLYDSHLYIIGGCFKNGTVSSEIHVIELVPPYTSRLLASLPEGMSHHSVQLFNNQIVIVGGLQSSWSYRSRVCNVFLYDISENKCKQLAPVLSAAVSEMATVRWGDNIIVLGGVDAHNRALNTVLMYNIRSQLSDVLPSMKYPRRGSVAAILGNSILVVGGATHGLTCLNTVECFDFERFSWQELSSMNEARYQATGVAF